jgi:S-adenosylmethionine/arginine decarboxylase-like enzyme
LVALNQPATFIISHTTRVDKDDTDRFVLNVETTDKFPQSGKICMVIAVYNKGCPLHNSPATVKTAEMWTTALESATLTIRADRFCFSDNFYVSVVILLDDSDCTVHTNYGEEQCNVTKRC